MKKIINVSTGEVKLGLGDTILRSSAIGSCIVIVAYNLSEKAGVMAHVMLPGSAPEDGIDKTRYAADAINQLIDIMPGAKLPKSNIEACLIGAANVLKIKDETICQANIDSITNILKEKNISVKALVLGRAMRKTVSMDIGTGFICYTEGNREEKVLWKAWNESGKQ